MSSVPKGTSLAARPQSKFPPSSVSGGMGPSTKVNVSPQPSGLTAPGAPNASRQAKKGRCLSLPPFPFTNSFVCYPGVQQNTLTKPADDLPEGNNSPPSPSPCAALSGSFSSASRLRRSTPERLAFARMNVPTTAVEEAVPAVPTPPLAGCRTRHEAPGITRAIARSLSPVANECARHRLLTPPPTGSKNRVTTIGINGIRRTTAVERARHPIDQLRDSKTGMIDPDTAPIDTRVLSENEKERSRVNANPLIFSENLEAPTILVDTKTIRANSTMNSSRRSILAKFATMVMRSVSITNVHPDLTESTRLETDLRVGASSHTSGIEPGILVPRAELESPVLTPSPLGRIETAAAVLTLDKVGKIFPWDKKYLAASTILTPEQSDTNSPAIRTGIPHPLVDAPPCAQATELPWVAGSPPPARGTRPPLSPPQAKQPSLSLLTRMGRPLGESNASGTLATEKTQRRTGPSESWQGSEGGRTVLSGRQNPRDALQSPGSTSPSCRYSGTCPCTPPRPRTQGKPVVPWALVDPPLREASYAQNSLRGSYPRVAC